jgi:quinol monooxygenase YgiN
MVMTILEARVTPERWQELELAYRKGLNNTPPELLQTFLIQDTKDRNLWRIISLWKSHEAFLESQRSGATHTCEEMFRKVDVEPTRRIFKPVAHHITV